MQNSRRFYAFVPLILLMFAPSPYVGINCLSEANGAILASDGGGSDIWISHDGGFTWESESDPPYPYREGLAGCSGGGSIRTVDTVIDPANPQIQYRFKQAWSIERSEDGGETWQVEVDLRGTDARVTYFLQQTSVSTSYYGWGPRDALIDPRTGNLIVAMSFEGVLVRTTDAEWHWQSVGEWHRIEMPFPFALMNLLSIPLIIAAAFALLITLTVRVLAQGWNAGLVIAIMAFPCVTILAEVFLLQNLSPASIVIISIGFIVIPLLAAWALAKYVVKRQKVAFFTAAMGWTFWVLMLVFFTILDGNMSRLAAIVLAIYLGVTVLLGVGKARAFWLRVGLGVMGLGASTLPYFLWGIGAIAFHEEAFWSSLVCAVIALAGSIILTKRLAPLDEKPPIPENPALRDVPSPAV